MQIHFPVICIYALVVPGDQFRQTGGYQGNGTKVLEEENEHMEKQLSAKVKTLKHVRFAFDMLNVYYTLFTVLLWSKTL